MTAVTLSVLVPVLVGGMLALTSSIERPRPAAVVAVGAALASAVLLAITVGRVGRDGRLIVWWGEWAPHGRVAGIDFAVDGLGAGLALFVAVVAVPALIMAGYAIRESAQ